MSERYGAVRRPDGRVHCAALAGETILDISGLAPSLQMPVLNQFLCDGPEVWKHVRSGLSSAPEITDAQPTVPVWPPDYVDFYSSIEHASNLGRMFRPDAEPLLPNWRHLPVAYNGRSSSVVVSGTPIRRPQGQRPPAEEGGSPTFGPTQRLDIELELGFVTGGPPTELGEPIPIERAADHIFGFVLVNDWSARDIQRWEYVPLGPFLGKTFATSISAWITPLDALARVPGPVQEPEPLPHLRTNEDWALDVDLEVELNGAVIARTNARGLYWNAAQQLAHATSNGCNVRPGDLYASGTISGSEPGTYGSLIELTWGGRDPIELPDGSTRTFLEDGDTVVLRGSGLSEVEGTILPAA